MNVELKANLVERILGRLFAIFRGEQFRGVVGKFVRRNYNKGMMAREVTLRMNTNPIPDEKRIDVMTDYTTTEIQGVMGDLNKQVAQTIREGIMSNENPDEVRKKVKQILNPTDESTFQYPSGRRMNWRDRIRMITRTESARAQNMGHMDTFRQSGLEGKKYLSTTDDLRRCKVCEEAAEKYPRENAIPIDEEFVVHDGKRTYRFQMPPIHGPQCRCLVAFRIGKDEGENA